MSVCLVGPGCNSLRPCTEKAAKENGWMKSYKCKIFQILHSVVIWNYCFNNNPVIMTAGLFIFTVITMTLFSSWSIVSWNQQVNAFQNLVDMILFFKWTPVGFFLQLPSAGINTASGQLMKKYMKKLAIVLHQLQFLTQPGLKPKSSGLQDHRANAAQY